MSDDPRVLDGAIAPERNTRLFGHEDTTRFLADAYRSGHMHHALLLEGPKGIGKATLAFRLANHILTHPEADAAPSVIADPDPESPVTHQIATGASHSLLHLARPIDPKSGRIRTAITVDEVRRAGRFYEQTSGTGNWRIVIVDPADDLNRSAANAILKILEEPPRRSLFILVSHAAGRLLPTIRSRCMTINMHPLSHANVLSALSNLGLEQTEDPETLSKTAASSAGSLATALLLLRYGGLDIIDAFQQIVSRGADGSAEAPHKLGDMLSARDRDEAYAFFKDHVVGWISQKAIMDARAGDRSGADRWAELALEIGRELDTADVYNLDRKQAVLSVFSSIFQLQAA